MATKEFSLILPTRDRPKLAYRLLKSIAETTSNIDKIEVVLYIDEDDVDSRQINYPGVSLLKIVGNDKNMGAIINKCYAQSQGKFIMLLNDDMIFRTKNWDETILKEFVLFPDGIALIYGNDLYYGKKVPTFPVLSRIACKIMGHVCPAEYRRHCIESHLFDIFSRLAGLGHNRLVYLPKAVFEHMHYELSTVAYDLNHRPMDNRSDQNIFSAFAVSRQNTAIRLAKHIDSYDNGVKCKP